MNEDEIKDIYIDAIDVARSFVRNDMEAVEEMLGSEPELDALVGTISALSWVTYAAIVRCSINEKRSPDEIWIELIENIERTPDAGSEE
jgi:hypothetical protein